MDYSKFAEEAANRVGWWWLEQEKFTESGSATKENEEMAATNYSKSAEEAANRVGLWWLDEEKTNECAEKGYEQMNKGVSMKHAGGFSDREAPFDKTSRVEPRCSHQQFLDSSNLELFPTKKSAVEGSDGRPVPGNPYVNLPWETTSSFQTVQSCAGRFSDRLFESELPSSINLGCSNLQSIDSGNTDIERKDIVDQYGINASNVSHNMEDHGSYLTYGGVRKVKVNQVKDGGNGIPMQLGNAFCRGDCSSISFNGFQEAAEADPRHCVLSQFNCSFNDLQDACVRGMPTVGMSHIRDISKMVSGQLDNSFSLHDSSNESFNGFPVEAEMRNYDTVTSQSSIQQSPSSIQHSEVLKEKEVADTVSTDLVVNATSVPLVLPSVSSVNSKPKNGTKESKNLVPNSFPSNVRCLLNTGILDGVPVKYVVGKNEELRGIIKSAGYLCGCNSCNYSKVLNAYEFEKHAGTKSKHPNNHIYFGNGKTVYAVAQELKATSPKMLFNAIENCAGHPINQKAFATWKESYIAASRELERIYGRDLLKLSSQSGD